MKIEVTKTEKFCEDELLKWMNESLPENYVVERRYKHMDSRNSYNIYREETMTTIIKKLLRNEKITKTKTTMVGKLDLRAYPPNPYVDYNEVEPRSGSCEDLENFLIRLCEAVEIENLHIIKCRRIVA